LAMTDDELRALVREAIAHRLQRDNSPRVADMPASFAGHASHARYQLLNPTDACLIEPAVRCNHCGYCKSHGY